MITAERPGETEAQRNDRNLVELLQELRVAAVGVQVIFGFLLSLPFYARFSALGHAQRVLYLVAVVLSAVSTALLLGPVAYHRLVFRHHQKHHLVRVANVMVIAGLAAVARTPTCSRGPAPPHRRRSPGAGLYRRDLTRWRAARQAPAAGQPVTRRWS